MHSVPLGNFLCDRLANFLPVSTNREPDATMLYLRNNGHALSVSTRLSDFLDQGCQINEACYYEPSRAPLIDITDLNRGTCVQGVICPSAHFDFSYDHEHITVRRKKFRSVDRSTYQEFLVKRCKENLSRIYSKFSSPTLLYSGGIDSLFLLALIQDLGLLPRTNLLTIFNTLSPQNILHDSDRLLAFQESQIYARSHGATTQSLTFQEEDFRRILLKKSYLDTTEYISSWLLDQCPSQVFIIGGPGNHVLLHKDFIATEIYHHTRDRQFDITKRYMADRDFSSAPRKPLDQNSVLIKKQFRWHKNNSVILAPMTDGDIFDHFHGIDFDTLRYSDAVCVDFAREIINSVDGTFDDFITRECVHEYDALSAVDIRLDKDILSALEIPELPWHNPKGHQYLRESLTASWQKGRIDLNLVTAINLMQNIRKF